MLPLASLQAWTSYSLAMIKECKHTYNRFKPTRTDESSRMGGLLTLGSFNAVFPSIDVDASPRPNYTSTIQGITVASYNLGCFLGAVATIWIGDYLGRRKTIFIGSAIMVVGAALQCSSFSLGQLIAGRVITGLGNGTWGMVVYSNIRYRSLIGECRLEYIHSTDLAIRNQQKSQTWPDGYDRGCPHHWRYHDIILARLWILLPRTEQHLLEASYRFPDHFCPDHLDLHYVSSRVSSMAYHERERGRSYHGSLRTQ